VKRLVALAGVLGALVFGGTLAYGAATKIGVSGKEAAWAADQFMSSALWAGLCTLVAAVGAALSMKTPSKLTYLVEVTATLAVSVSAGFTFASAIAAERMNYWDAIHFSTIVWVGVVSAIASTVIAGLATRRGDLLVRAFGWLPGLVLAVWVVLWLVTWFEPLGDFLAWVASSWYLATHG
jgi:hypothetical protein